MLIPIPDLENVRLGDDRGMQVQTLLGRLPEATILHLACHGIQDAEIPLNSGFVMSDGTLTISKLIGVSSPRAFLAFLSACETAKGDKVRGVWWSCHDKSNVNL
jgi:CHAT domain-containing protein